MLLNFNTFRTLSIRPLCNYVTNTFTMILFRFLTIPFGLQNMYFLNEKTDDYKVPHIYQQKLNLPNSQCCLFSLLLVMHSKVYLQFYYLRLSN